MRTAASIAALTLALLMLGTSPVSGEEICRFDPSVGQIVCEDSGVIVDLGSPGDDPWVVPGSGGLRYLYQTTDPVAGDCYFWSNVPGGLDTWDPANDAVVIGVVIGTPECPPVLAVDPEARAWEIFRSWSLMVPDPTLQPADHGITGLPSFLATSQPDPITSSEILPDGRTLEVRADVIRLDVAWGDGEVGAYVPEQANPYPDGAVTHTYHLKTCNAEYRLNHPSGGLCHPALDHYTIDVSFAWGGSYRVGGTWIDLGTLTRDVSIAYDVDEARGVLVP